MPDKAKVEYLNVDEFFRSAKRVSLSKEVRATLLQEQEEQVLDQDQIRYQEDWSFLSTKVVGAEGSESS